MPLKQSAPIEITAFAWVPEFVHGMVKDLRVRWALEEAGLDYQVRLIGSERPAGYRNDQPFDQVPCFRDQAVRIFETGAILQYIGEKSDALLPTDLQGRFAAIQWVYAAVNSVEPFVQHRVLLERVWADQDWAEPSKPTADKYARLRLEQLADRLGDGQWLEGDRFTIGDLMMITVLRLADWGGLIEPGSSLASYMARGESRPAFQRAIGDQLSTYATNRPKGEAA